MSYLNVRNLNVLMLLILLSALLIGCEREGPAERAGKKLDEVAEDVRDSGEDIGNAIEDACEDVKKEAGAEDKDC